MRNRSGFAFVDLVIVTAILTGIVAVSIAPLLASGRLANERAAVVSLKVITVAEADFRSNDRDGNRVSDFWTADVFGLYGMIPITGADTTIPKDSVDADKAIKLLEPSLAAADGRTDQAWYGNVEFASSIGMGRLKRGYVFRALHNEVTGGAATTLLFDTDGADQFYGACHDNDRFGFIAFPISLKSGRSMYVVNEDNTIWKYVLSAGYVATLTGSAGAATDSTSTTAGAGLAPDFTLTAASGQGTFPAAPARIGCSPVGREREPDWEAVLKETSLSLSESIDKGLTEAGEGTVTLAEIEPDGGKAVCAMDIARGKEVVAVNLDLKDGKVLEKETATDDQLALIKKFKVTAMRAIEFALKETPGQALAVELVTDKGRPILRVRIWSKGKVRVATVNGEDGSVTSVGDR
jgi:uncharacterized membrane protein YkoI